MTDLIIKADKQTGEEREGSYVARARIGTEKDGSPMYRYFKTVEEYKTYLKNKSGDSEDKKGEDGLDTSLKEKTDKERKQSKKEHEKFAKEKKRDLFLKKERKEKKEKKVSKSLLVVGVK